MMTFSSQDLAHFMRSKRRSNKPALEVLRELDKRTGAPTVRKATPTALAESTAAKAGRKLTELTSGEAGWLLWPFPLYPSERA